MPRAIPPPDVTLVDDKGLMTRDWYDFLRGLSTLAIISLAYGPTINTNAHSLLDISWRHSFTKIHD